MFEKDHSDSHVEHKARPVTKDQSEASSASLWRGNGPKEQRWGCRGGSCKIYFGCGTCHSATPKCWTVHCVLLRQNVWKLYSNLMMPAESNNKNSGLGFDMSLAKFHFSGNSIFCTILADRLRSLGHLSMRSRAGSEMAPGLLP